MSLSASEKLEMIRLVEGSDLPVGRTLRELQVSPSTFYDWYRGYSQQVYDGLVAKKPALRRHWNRTPAKVREHVVSNRPATLIGLWQESAGRRRGDRSSAFEATAKRVQPLK